MRYLTDKTNDEIQVNEKDEINTELIDLGNRIEANKEAISSTNERIDALINKDTCDKPYAIHNQTTTDALDVTSSANLPDTLVDGNLTVNGDIELNNLNGNDATLKDIKANDIEANSIDVTDVSTNNVTTSTLSTTSINAVSGEFQSLHINTADVDEFNLAEVNTGAINADEAHIDEISSEIISAPQAELDDITAELVKSDSALLMRLQTHNIIYDDTEKDPFYVHIEPQDVPSATDYRILKIPYFDTGDYYLSLRDPGTDISWWSLIVHNNFSNITISYSRRSKDLSGAPLTVPTLDEVIIYDFDSVAPCLYIKTYVGGNLYWQNQSLREDVEPEMYNEYPFDVSLFGAMRYKCLHTAATWFSHHLDIGKDKSAGNASLFLIPTDWNNATKEQIEYNTERDIPYNYYIPDQSLDTTDEVTFKDLVIEPLEGRWVYNVENALKGRDGVIIDDGQLNSYPWLIETGELSKWNGKVGTKVDNKTPITGTIYRDQAWEEVNQYLYRKVDIDTYDICEYESSSSRDDVLVLRRKMDTERGKKEDLVVSAPYVKGTYEDADGTIWDEYRYVFYGEYDSGSMYTIYIERTVNNEVISRVLESTVDSSEYIQNVVLFKDEFTTGTVLLDKFSFDDYHKPLEYLGNVKEGTWGAGDVHITKKKVDLHSSDYTSNDFDYDGTLTVDGTTKLRDSITIINDFDETDIKPVESITADVDDVTARVTDDITIENSGTTSLTLDSNVELNIGTEDAPATITNAIIGDTTNEVSGAISTTIEGAITNAITGDVTSTVTGDIENTIEGAVTNTIEGDVATDITGDVTLTYGTLELIGHKFDEFGDEIPGSNLLIRDDVTIGKPNDKHNLTTNGKLTITGESNLQGDVLIGIDDPDEPVPANLHVLGDATIEGKLRAGQTELDGLTIHNDLFIEHDLILDHNARISGDLLVDGSLIATDESTIETSSDYAILRKNKETGLSSTEKSGLIVHNYNGTGSNAGLVVDKDGIFRVSDNEVESVTNYTNVLYYDGTYYDKLTTDTVTVIAGAAVSQDADDFSDVVKYNDDYYHWDNTNWFKLKLEDNVLTYGVAIDDEALINALDALDKKSIQYYRSLSILTVNDATNQPLLTRSEADDLYDKAPLMWDAANNKAVKMTLDPPEKNKLAVISKIDKETGELHYEWGKAGSGSGAVLALTQEQYDLRIQITDMDDDNYIPNNAMIVITDADEEYLKGEVEE